MRLSEARIPELPPEEWPDEIKEMLAAQVKQGNVFNIFKTLANHPDLMRRWVVFANHILGKSSLSVRERELAILRIGYLCQSGYEWGQHVVMARAAGVSDEDIRCVKEGPGTDGLTPHECLVLKATDELHADAFVTDATWQGLSETYSQRQMMDLVFTVGQYNMVSMVLNSFGVQLDDGLPGFDV